MCMSVTSRTRQYKKTRLWKEVQREREGWIHGGVEGSHQIEEKQDQKEVEGIVVEDGKRCCFSVSHFILLPGDPVKEGGEGG